MARCSAEHAHFAAPRPASSCTRPLATPDNVRISPPINLRRYTQGLRRMAAKGSDPFRDLLICQIAKDAANKGSAATAHRRASGFVEFSTVRADSELMWRHGGEVTQGAR